MTPSFLWTYYGAVGRRHALVTVAAETRHDAIEAAHFKFDAAERQAGLPISDIRTLKFVLKVRNDDARNDGSRFR